jgi:hypothetical protein
VSLNVKAGQTSLVTANRLSDDESPVEILTSIPHPQLRRDPSLYRAGCNPYSPWELTGGTSRCPMKSRGLAQ